MYEENPNFFILDLNFIIYNPNFNMDAETDFYYNNEYDC